MTALHDDAGLREALQDCLARLEAGATPAEALAACPDADLRPRLAVLIAPAVGLREAHPIPADRGEAIRASLGQLAAELYPAGSAPPTDVPPDVDRSSAPQSRSLPGGRFPIRLFTIAAIGLGLALVAWSTTRTGPPERPLDAVPTSPVEGMPAASVGEEEHQSPLATPPRDRMPDVLGSATAQVSKAADQAGDVSAGEGNVVAPGVAPGDVVVPSAGGPPCLDVLGGDLRTDIDGTDRAADPGAGMTQIIGRVVDGDCRPVPDAIVILSATDGSSEFLARSEPDGTYVLTLPPDRYRAEILADGYAIRGWFDGRSYLEAPDVDLRLGGVGSPDHLDFVLTGSPTGGFR